MKIGDPVEVKFARYDSSRGRPAVEEWRPATVVMISDAAIAVAFSDGTRKVLPRGRHRFRRMKRGEDME